ncbi:hypothetical protein DVH24_013254 [Malus domestica]|uniref:Cation-transporting P-type ATPase C-terminal domain-containing protein n=1 Tax=Malus domestica TaxID=3750 RepID=A0A498HGB5_MALDO|nr:hypothetical protein DVH24_013254 [Malus domestica]
MSSNTMQLSEFDHGIQGDHDGEDIAHRQEVFGSNTYKIPPPKGFFYRPQTRSLWLKHIQDTTTKRLFHFVCEAFKDLTILILIGYATLSLGSGIHNHGLNEGNTDDENGNPKFDGSKTKANDIIYAVVGIVAVAVTIVVVAILVGVKTSVRDCQKAGVKIKMITGDNVFTAKAIATECGILKHDEDMSSGAVIEGMQFRNYTPQEKREKVDEICVMARSSPSDKLLMVFSEFNARKLEQNVFKGTRKPYLGIIAVTIVLQVLMLEFLNKFSDRERLHWKQWLACFGIVAFSWPIGWLAKRVDFQVLWELQLSLTCKLFCKGSLHSNDV